MRSADVAIVGAGVIGSAVAYALSRLTHLRIVVVDRGMPGCEASNAAAGVLAVASARARRGVLLALRRTSAEMFPELVGTLTEETGIDLGYRRSGVIAVALAASQVTALCEDVDNRRRQGLRGEMLEPARMLSIEPAINPNVCAAAFFPDDCVIDSQRLVAALVAAARQRGVQFELQTPVRSLSRSGGAVRLELARGSLEAAVVVIAAGAWSGELLALCGIKVPLRPSRGEMAALRAPSWQLQHTLSTGDGYLVPGRGGEVLVGSTTAFVGFDKRVTTEGLETLLARAAKLVPRLRQATVARSWAGLRPCSTIRRPIIAALPGLDNVILATGHHRNGILLAPITAKLVAEMITGTPPSVPLAPLSYRKH